MNEGIVKKNNQPDQRNLKRQVLNCSFDFNSRLPQPVKDFSSYSLVKPWISNFLKILWVAVSKNTYFYVSLPFSCHIADTKSLS